MLLPYADLCFILCEKTVSGLCFGICMVPIICQGKTQIYDILKNNFLINISPIVIFTGVTYQ